LDRSGNGTATGSAGRSLVFAADKGGFAVTGFAVFVACFLADRFFGLLTGALRVALFLAAVGRFLLAAAFLFFFTAALVFLDDVFLADVFFLAAALRVRFALRVPADRFAALPRFDFDFFAMGHSAVSGCSFRQEWPLARPSGYARRRAISRTRHRQGGRTS
jgi:hypothetical protein